MRVAVVFVMLMFLGQFRAAAIADDLRVGDLVRGEIALGNGFVRRVFPLPAGEWRVLRVRNADGRRDRQVDQLNPPRSVDVMLALVEGKDLIMLMRIFTLREPTAIRRWSLQDEPCKRTNVLHQNTYDSTVWASKCLEVDHIAGFLTTSTNTYSDVRRWVAAEGVAIPSTSLHGFFTLFGDYHNLTVRVWVNPALRKLDSEERVGAANPFHPDWRVKEPERKRYVDEFVAWCEGYMALLMRNSGTPEQKTVPVFR